MSKQKMTEMSQRKNSLRLVVFSLSKNADTGFLAWWSLTAQEKGLLQDSKELKMN